MAPALRHRRGDRGAAPGRARAPAGGAARRRDRHPARHRADDPARGRPAGEPRDAGPRRAGPAPARGGGAARRQGPLARAGAASDSRRVAAADAADPAAARAARWHSATSGASGTSLARLNLGEILYREGDYGGAERELRAVVSRPAHERLGAALAGEGRPRPGSAAGGARPLRARARPRGRRRRARRGGGRSPPSTGAPDVARRIAGRLSRDAADARPTRRSREAILASAEGQSGKAERELRAALALDPARVEALQRLVDLLARRGPLAARPRCRSGGRRHARRTRRGAGAPRAACSSRAATRPGPSEHLALALRLAPDAASVRLELARALSSPGTGSRTHARIARPGAAVARAQRAARCRRVARGSVGGGGAPLPRGARGRPARQGHPERPRVGAAPQRTLARGCRAARPLARPRRSPARDPPPARRARRAGGTLSAMRRRVAAPRRPPRRRSRPPLWLARAARGAAERPARDDRHAPRRPPGLLRLRGGRHTGPRRPRRAGRALRDRDRPRAAHRAVARLDPHRAAAARPRRARQRLVRPAARPRRRWPRPSATRGYRTAAFVSGFPLDHRFGFARGFETYDDRLPRGRRPAARRLRRAHGRRRRRAPAARLDSRRRARPGSSGCTTSTPTPPTSRPASSPRASPRAPTTARSPSSTASSGGCWPPPRRHAAEHARPRHLRPRREPGRARRGDARRLRLRRDAAGAVDHGRAWRPARPGVAASSPAASTSPPRSSTSRVCASRARMQGRSLRPAADGQRDGGRPGLRRVALLPASTSAGPSSTRWRTARCKLDRGAAARALRPRRRDPGEARDVVGRSRRTRREPCARRCGGRSEARPPDASHDPEREAARAPARARLRGRHRARASHGARPEGRDRARRAARARPGRGAGPSRRSPIEELSAFLAEEPDAPLARRHRAIAYQFAGRYAEAVADIRALEARGRSRSRTSPCWPSRCGSRAATTRRSPRSTVRRPPTPGRPSPRCCGRARCGPWAASEDARAALRQALALDPGERRGPARAWRSWRSSAGRSTRRRRSWRRSLARRPDGRAGARQAGRRAHARRAASTRRSPSSSGRWPSSPSNPEALLDLAGALGKSGRSREAAIPYFEKAIAGRRAHDDGAQRPRRRPSRVGRRGGRRPRPARVARPRPAPGRNRRSAASGLRRDDGEPLASKKPPADVAAPRGGPLAARARGWASRPWRSSSRPRRSSGAQRPAPPAPAPRPRTCCSSRSTRRGPTASAATATRRRRRATSTGWPRRGRASRPRSRRRPSRCPRTLASSPASTPSSTGSATTGTSTCAERLRDAGHAPQGPGLPHRGLRQLVHPRPPLRPRPRLRRLRRPHGGRVRAGRHAAGGAARGPHGAGARAAGIDERAKEPDGRPSSRGSTSTTRTSPTGRRRPFRDLFADDPYDGEIAFADAIVASVLDRLRPAGLARPHPGRGDGRPRREPGRARRVDALDVRLRGGHPRAARALATGPRARGPGGRGARAPRSTSRRRCSSSSVRPRSPAPHARSLVPLLEGRGASAPPPAYSETLLPKFYMNWAPLRSLRDGRYKLIDAPRPELYDLATRPRRVPQPVRRAAADRRGAARGPRAAQRPRGTR